MADENGTKLRAPKTQSSAGLIDARLLLAAHALQGCMAQAYPKKKDAVAAICRRYADAVLAELDKPIEQTKQEDLERTES